MMIAEREIRLDQMGSMIDVWTRACTITGEDDVRLLEYLLSL